MHYIEVYISQQSEFGISLECSISYATGFRRIIEITQSIFFSRDGHHEAYDTEVGGRCCEVSGNDLTRRHPHPRRHASDDVYVYQEEESSMSCNSSIGKVQGIRTQIVKSN